MHKCREKRMFRNMSEYLKSEMIFKGVYIDTER